MPAILLISTFQNCGQNDTGNTGVFRSCLGYLCDDPGIGNIGSMRIVVSPDAMVLPYTGSAPYKLKINGTCNDGGFKRNKIKAQLTEDFRGESDCENGEIFTVYSKCESGSFIAEIDIPSTNSICNPANRSQTLQLQVDLIGIDTFDNEYNPANASLAGFVDVKKSIKLPSLNSLAAGAAEDGWIGTRIVSSDTSTMDIYDFVGFCSYSPNIPANNKIDLHIKPYGLPDLDRLTFTQLDIQCQSIQSAAAQVQTKASQLGYDGYFEINNSIVRNYLEGQPWPGLTGVASVVNSRNFTFILAQKDTNISSTYKLENQQDITLKFNSIDNSQGWTVEMLRQAQKQTKRLINFSWDDSTVDDSDISKILNTGTPYPYRLWILEKMLLTEDFATFKVYSSNVSFNPFYDRIGKIAYAGKKCDSRISGDMPRGISGTDGVNSYSTSNTQQQRLALCMWYWTYHGLLDNNSLDTNPNWLNHYSAAFINEGVKFNGSSSSCSSYTSNKAGDAAECQKISTYFNRINTMKTNYLGATYKIYGDSGSNYKSYQTNFNQAFAQYLVNQIMTEVGKNLVSTTTIATANNLFFDSVITNVFETSTNPSRLYGTAAASLEKRKLVYPIELNIPKDATFTPKPFQTYKTKNTNGSVDANGSENDPVRYPSF